MTALCGIQIGTLEAGIQTNPARPITCPRLE
jgi:hypothetical protein